MSDAAKDPATDCAPASHRRMYTTFQLRHGMFGTTPLPPMTPIPHAPAAIRGYVNLRGHIVLVVDLYCLLQREPTAIGPECQLIVFKPELGDAFGVLVERIGEIIELSAEQIEGCRAATEHDGSSPCDWPEDELIRGVGKLDGELLSIIEARGLLPCLQRAVAAVGATPTEEILP